MKRKLIYVCSPFRAQDCDGRKNVEQERENLKIARDTCNLVMKQGNLPIAPHLYFPQFLYDFCEKQRELGVKVALELLENADELWVVGDTISEGMAREIGKAGRLGLPIKHVPIPESKDDLLFKVLFGGKDDK